MVNKVSSWIEFPVLNAAAKRELVRLFTDLSTSENGAEQFESVIMKIVGSSDPQKFDTDKYFEKNWCEIQEQLFEDDRSRLTLLSSWAAPKTALNELAIYLGDIDPNLMMTLKYEDEKFPAGFFGWATYLAGGIDEGEEIEDDEYYEIACNYDPSVKQMDAYGEEYASYIEENFSDVISDYVEQKLRFEINWHMENNCTEQN